MISKMNHCLPAEFVPFKVAPAMWNQFTESLQHQSEETDENALEESLRNFLVAHTVRILS